MVETLLSAHMGWLAERAPQVNFSAQILFQELRASRGYEGGYDTVRNAVRPLRVEATAAALTQRRFETEPGQQAQVDWGQVRTRFASEPAEVHIFVMTLGYSRRAWAEGYQNERLGALLAAHEHAFAHFGGCTAEILYDRIRTVTLGTTEGKPRWNPTFEAFARHWGFEPRLCRPYRAQTKALTSWCTLFGWLSGNKPGGRASVAAAGASDELDIARGLVQATMVVAVQVPLEHAQAAQLVNGRRRDAQLQRDLFAGEHATLAQPLEAALERVGPTHQDDLLHREGLASPVVMAELVQPHGDLPVCRGLEQFVNEPHHVRQGLADLGHRPRPLHPQALRATAAPAHMDVDLRG